MGRSAQFMKKIGKHTEALERVKKLIKEMFTRSLRGNSEVKDQFKFFVFKHIWSYQAIMGFLDHFHGRSLSAVPEDEDEHKKDELMSNRLNFTNASLFHLERLFYYLFDSSIEEFKVI